MFLSQFLLTGQDEHEAKDPLEACCETERVSFKRSSLDCHLWRTGQVHQSTRALVFELFFFFSRNKMTTPILSKPGWPRRGVTFVLRHETFWLCYHRVWSLTSFKVRKLVEVRVKLGLVQVVLVIITIVITINMVLNIITTAITINVVLVKLWLVQLLPKILPAGASSQLKANISNKKVKPAAHQ